MDRDQMINMFLMTHAKSFPTMSLPVVKEKLYSLNESQLMNLQALDLKDPTMMLIISIVGGTLGIDRFLIGDIGMGILKLLTAGLCGILTIIDWFNIQNMTRQKNLQSLLSIY